MAGRKTKKTEEPKVQETVAAPQLPKKRIIPNKDVAMRKFPTLQQSHVIGTAKAGTMYVVADTIGTPYGWFYRLACGGYVVKEEDYKFV